MSRTKDKLNPTVEQNNPVRVEQPNTAREYTNGTGTAPETTTKRRFSPESLQKHRANTDHAVIGVKQIQAVVHIRKPGRQTWFRCRKDLTENLSVVVEEDSRDVYYVDDTLADELQDELKFKHLIAYITRRNDIGVWPVSDPQEGNRLNTWAVSALIATELAENQWCRISPNMGQGCYEVHVAENLSVEPVWPDLTMEQILETAFKGKLIESLDHPILKNIRGEE